MRETWTCSYTADGRYDDMGITRHILNHSVRTGRGKFDVIDVCCSTGAAIKKCKSLLGKEGITLHTTGIDLSDRVEERARANLDRFMRLEMLEEYDGSLDGTADIVVCVNALRFVKGPTRRAMTERCAKLLGPGGILVTDVKGYGRSADRRGLDSLDCRRYVRMRGNRLLSFLHPYRFCCEVKSMSEDDAVRYAERIRAGWEGMGVARRGWEWVFRVVVGRASRTASA